MQLTVFIASEIARRCVLDEVPCDRVQRGTITPIKHQLGPVRRGAQLGVGDDGDPVSEVRGVLRHLADDDLPGTVVRGMHGR